MRSATGDGIELAVRAVMDFVTHEVELSFGGFDRIW